MYKNVVWLSVWAGSGSDAGSMLTRAQLDEAADEFVINGGKAFISGAG